VPANLADRVIERMRRAQIRSRRVEVKRATPRGEPPRRPQRRRRPAA
jgi:hypothetical protein